MATVPTSAPEQHNTAANSFPRVQVFRGEWDEEGVYVYQAYNDAIADYAIAHQAFGGPDFRPRRMTWVKPSFAWVLFRSGYARKHNQTRILKIKISHASLATLLSKCDCQHGGGGSMGRVQWDPERDIMTSENNKGQEPRKMMRQRAIQIGFKGDLSEQYVASILSIEDVTALAHKVEAVHKSMATASKMNSKSESDVLSMDTLELPPERAYMPHCSDEVLCNLAMKEGATAEWVAQLGLGCTGTQ